MLLTQKKAIHIYMIVNGFTSCVDTMLRCTFSTLLFTQDISGISSAYLEPPILLGVALMGVLGGVFLKRISSPSIGIGCPIIISIMLLALFFINVITPFVAYTTLFIFSFFVSLEHANGLDMMNKCLDNLSKPFFLSSFQTYLSVFNIIAPLSVPFLLIKWGSSYLFIICASIYTLRIIPWLLIRKINIVRDHRSSSISMFAGFKEILYDSYIRNMILYRIINSLAMVGYTTAIHLFIAKIAAGNTVNFATIYGSSLSIINLGTILMGALGSYLLKRNPICVIYFFRVAPFFTVSACIIGFYAVNAYVIFITALLHGMGQYFLKTSGLIIGQALTRAAVFTQVVLAGDASMKLISYGIGTLVPILVNMPPIGGILPTFIAFSLGAFCAIPIQKRNSKKYLSILEEEAESDAPKSTK